MQLSIFCNREDFRKVEAEERDRFIKDSILSLGIDLDMWPDDEELSPERKIDFINYLSKFKIEIIHDGDRGYSLFASGELFAEWKKPRAVLRRDPMAKQQSKKFYYEMIIDTWSQFQDEG